MRLIRCVALSGALALLLTISTFAQQSHVDAGEFDLQEPARVGSTLLQPGHYRVEWLGPNGDVQVSILHNGKIVATGQGRIIELPQPAPYGSVTLKIEPDNSKRVGEIDFSNRKDALVLSGALSST